MSTAVFVTRSVDAPPQRLLDLHARWPERYPAYLESVARGSTLGCFDLLFAHPTNALTRLGGGGSFLSQLDDWMRAEWLPPIDCPLPFSGGWVLFVAYEIAREVEPALELPRAAHDAIEALALRVPAAFLYEHDAARMHLVAEAGRGHLLDGMLVDLESCPSQWNVEPLRALDIEEDPPEEFLHRVRRVKEYIRAGDVYQVNLSRGWRARLPAPAAQIYRALRAANPAPFAASLVIGDQAILSSSPERLFAIRDGEITTRPIAGTRPRSGRPGADTEEKSTLVSHPKERAEHVMLIDLERNDLGRICRPGTVRVDEFMVLESYAHVHHIVSNVRGRLTEDATPAGVLRAVFPGGTITGCPKFRCMQIIAELECVRRGAYTGGLGYLNRDGTGDVNILIRSMTCSQRTGAIAFRAGAGIVADSDPERELEETRAKARGLLRALGEGA